MPIIITDYNSARDQIDNKKTGLIVENSIDGIFNGVKTIMEDQELRNDIVNTLKKSKWSNENEIEKFYEIIEK